MRTVKILAGCALITLSFWSAYALDTFGALILSLPGGIFFLGMVLMSVHTAINSRSLRDLKPLPVAAVGLILLISALKMSDHGLAELTKERELKMSELRPVILKYRADKGAYPERLEKLVPDYLGEIPVVLRTPADDDPYKRITYKVLNGRAVFTYRVARGPDSATTFDVESGKFSRDM